MACKQSVPAIISWKPPALGRRVRARSLAAALIVGAGVALSTMTAGVPSAAAQELRWATSAGGTFGDRALGIAVTIDGDVVVTGDFGAGASSAIAENATFGEGELNETTLVGSGAFVARYDVDGNLLWATRVGFGSSSVSGIVRGVDVAMDIDGNAVVTGSFQGTVTFGEDEANETTLVSASDDIFIARYDADGNLLWATRAGGPSGDQGISIAASVGGDTVVTGWFHGTVTFGEGEANETTVVRSGGVRSVFVARYDVDGNLLWATSAGGRATNVDDAGGLGTAIQSNGSVAVTGFFDGTAIFGVGQANETTFVNVDRGNDAFVARYDVDGKFMWAARVSQTDPQGSAHGTGIAIQPDDGSAMVTGTFHGTATFGEGEANETTLVSAGSTGSSDSFVARYDVDGNLLWVTRAGGTSNDNATDIAVDASSNTAVTGSFQGTATFGEGEANETTLVSAGFADIFIARYDADGNLLWATRAGAEGVEGAVSMAARATGDAVVTGLFLGTSTFGEGEANETTLSSAGAEDIFIAEYRASAGEDTDEDGVSDDLDFCPGTVLPEGVPTFRLLFNRFAIINQGPEFSTGRARPDAETFTIFDTAGCSCEQIIELMGLGNGHKRFGCSLGALRTFIGELSADRDQCPDSDLSATVMLDGIDTGVENALTNTEGCTIMDLIRQASDDAAHRADFIGQVALLTRTLLRDGLITSEEASIIRTAASQATFPLSLGRVR